SRFTGRHFQHLRHFGNLFIDIIQMPLLPFKGKPTTIGNGKEYYEFEHFFWVKMWYVAIPLVIFVVAINYTNIRQGLAVWDDYRNQVIQDQKFEIDQCDLSIKQYEDSLLHANHKADSIELLLASTQKEFIETWVAYDEYRCSIEARDSIALDTLEIQPLEEEPDIPEEPIQEEEQEEPTSKPIEIEPVQEEIVEEDEEPKPLPLGVMCIKCSPNCGMINGQLKINKQYVGDMKFWNPDGLKECGSGGTFTKAVTDGIYQIDFNGGSINFSKIINITKGDTVQCTIPCNP
ncbi:MAG: hypothetical protein AAF193_03840, partial [Bacteroidota bacterium]